jgi:hypothetical protein
MSHTSFDFSKNSSSSNTIKLGDGKEHTIDNINKPTRPIYLGPPFIASYNRYQNVNNDKNLQTDVTLYFLDEITKWFKSCPHFKKLKKYKKDFDGKNGFKIMHKILKIAVRRGYTNWYDMIDEYNLVKKWIHRQLVNV